MGFRAWGSGFRQSRTYIEGLGLNQGLPTTVNWETSENVGALSGVVATMILLSRAHHGPLCAHFLLAVAMPRNKSHGSTSSGIPGFTTVQLFPRSTNQVT